MVGEEHMARHWRKLLLTFRQKLLFEIQIEAIGLGDFNLSFLASSHFHFLSLILDF